MLEFPPCTKNPVLIPDISCYDFILHGTKNPVLIPDISCCDFILPCDIKSQQLISGINTGFFVEGGNSSVP